MTPFKYSILNFKIESERTHKLNEGLALPLTAIAAIISGLAFVGTDVLTKVPLLSLLERKYIFFSLPFGISILGLVVGGVFIVNWAIGHISYQLPDAELVLKAFRENLKLYAEGKGDPLYASAEEQFEDWLSQTLAYCAGRAQAANFARSWARLRAILAIVVAAFSLALTVPGWVLLFLERAN